MCVCVCVYIYIYIYIYIYTEFSFGKKIKRTCNMYFCCWSHLCTPIFTASFFFSPLSSLDSLYHFFFFFFFWSLITLKSCVPGSSNTCSRSTKRNLSAFFPVSLQFYFFPIQNLYAMLQNISAARHGGGEGRKWVVVVVVVVEKNATNLKTQNDQKWLVK